MSATELDLARHVQRVDQEANNTFSCLSHNAPFPSYHAIYLQQCSSQCISRLWQRYEQLRWKLSTNNCLLYHPFRICLSNININVFDIIIFTIFVLSQLIFFIQELSKETKSNEGPLSVRVIALILGRSSVYSFAIAWTLATRKSFWYLLIGIPFERALFYHIWIYRYAICLVWAHFALMLYFWWDNNQLEAIVDNMLISTNIAGLIALLCVSLIFIFSLSYFRRNHWEYFLKTHWIFFLMFFYFAIKHHYAYFWGDTYWMKIAIFCWLFDVLYRAYTALFRSFLSSNVKILHLQSLPNDITKLTLQIRNEYTACGAAQYFFICLPTISITEWHPFSVSNYNKSDGVATIGFHIKVLGDWTTKLHELAKRITSGNGSINMEKLKVFIEGPYGKLAIPIEKYNSIVLIGAGIGITPVANIFDHLMKYLQNNNITTITRIHFLWITRDPGYELLKEFNSLHWKSVTSMNDNDDLMDFKESFVINQTTVETHYFFTQCTDPEKMSLYTNLLGDGIHFCRPFISEFVLDGLRFGKTAVFACGPGGLMDSVRKESTKAGIHCHTEVFDF